MTPTRYARRWPLWTAAALGALTAAVHGLVGTGDTLGPLLADGALDPVVRQTFAAIWHVVTVLLVLLPVAVVWAGVVGPARGRAVLAGVWAVSLAFTLVFLAVDVVAFGPAVLTLPQWVLFAPALVLIPWAAAPSARTAPAPVPASDVR